MPRAKKLIPVSEDIIEELSKISRRSGVPVTELIEVILRQALRVLKTRDDVESFLVESVVRADMHRLGGFVVPFPALEALINHIGEDEFEDFLNRMSSFATALASSARVRGLSELLSVRGLLSLWIPSVQVDLESLSESSRLIIILPPQGASERLSRLVEAIAKALITGLGMEVLSSARNDFIVSIEFRPRGGERR